MNLRTFPTDDDRDLDAEAGVLAGLEIGERFHFWRGHSGRRYVFSIFRQDDHPAFERAVVVAVRRGPKGRRRPLRVGIIAGEEWHEFITAAAEIGTEEVHLHLLAGDEAARTAVVDDLDPHHRHPVAHRRHPR